MSRIQTLGGDKANTDHSNICHAGAAHFNDGGRTGARGSLGGPGGRFDRMNGSIHGIRILSEADLNQWQVNHFFNATHRAGTADPHKVFNLRKHK